MFVALRPARLLLTERCLKSSLVEIYTQKFSFYDELPWSLLGVYGGEVRAELLPLAKSAAAKAIGDYTKAGR